jgi:hypothetical protein
MGLTRPKIWDIDTSTAFFADPITVLHQGATSANVDVGFLFNRANGLVSNVAIYWSESAQSFVTAFTANSGSNYGNISASSYANLTIGSLLTVNGAAIVFASGAGINLNGSTGTTGQVLTASGTGGLSWAPPGTFSGGTVANVTTFNSNLVASSSTPSTSTTTGAIVVTGGVGISGQATIGGNISLISGYPATLFNSTVSSRVSTVGFKDGYNMYVDAANGGYLLLATNGGYVGIANTAPSHNLAVTGTAYISGNTTVVGNINVGGTANVGNLVTTSGVFWANGTSALSSSGTGGTGDPAGTAVAMAIALG